MTPADLAARPLRTVLLPALALALSLGLPAAARAGEVRVFGGGHLHFHADPGERNNLKVTISADGSTATFADSVATRGCESVGSSAVCRVYPEQIELHLGDGDDSARMEGSVATNFLGGPGADTLVGGAGDDIFAAGQYTHNPVDGADTMIGGAGRDWVQYMGRAQGVFVSLDGVANDGAPGEGDNVAGDIEEVLGTPHNDVLVGTAGTQYLFGEEGDDLLQGLGGRDYLEGGAGTDLVSYAEATDPVKVRVASEGDEDSARTGNPDALSEVEGVIGGRGDDILLGSGWHDILLGGPGNDRIRGGAGADTVDGGPGNDSIDVFDRGGRDVVRCGTGRDGVIADRRDAVTACEARERGPALRLSALALRRGKWRAIGRCSLYATEPCSAVIASTIRLIDHPTCRTPEGRKMKRCYDRKLIGARVPALQPGKKLNRRLRLSKKVRKILSESRRVTLSLYTVGYDGWTTSWEQKVKVRR